MNILTTDQQNEWLMSQVLRYVVKVWAITTFSSALIVGVAFPFWGMLALGGGIVILPFLIPLYYLTVIMYRHSISIEKQKYIIGIVFMGLVVLAVNIMAFAIGFGHLFTWPIIAMATPVFVIGLIAIVFCKLPEVEQVPEVD